MTEKAAKGGLDRTRRDVPRTSIKGRRCNLWAVATNDLGPVETKAELLRFQSWDKDEWGCSNRKADSAVAMGKLI